MQICLIKINPKTDRIVAPIKAVKISIEKYSFAFSFLPSPSVFATIALPPEPIINPIAPTPIATGRIRLTAANAVFPAKLEINNPSIILYIEVQIIIMIDGNTKRIRRL